ncbi:MAG: polysaccharide biosynthesis protein [Clostridia bacterium]|nr:polysaccharide biosynthesis protein [Clostridia bacterium]MBQ4338245.1 polysaccharide biosynthesis protein [Clostridia bacterium]
MDITSKTRTGTNAVKLTAAKVITLAIGMISSMLLSRFRTLTEYGTYSQLLMVINLASSLFMLGLPNCINYFLGKAKSDEERSQFLSVYYTLSTILSVIVGLILVLATPLLEMYFKNSLIKNFWYFLSVYPWTRVVMSSTENLLIAYNKNNMLMLYKFLNSAALLGAILIVQLLNGTFNQYMVLFLAVEAVFSVWTYVFAKKNALSFKPSLNIELVKTIFVFSVPIGLASMIGTINIELDKLVITSFFSTEDLALFANASRELPVTIISTSLTAVLMPQVVKLLHNDQKKEAVELWNSATTISFAIICFVSMACLVFAPEVITVLYSEKYIPGVDVFRVYSLVLLCRCTYFGMLLNATGKTRFILYSSIGTLVLNMILNYTCYRLFGFVGPAIATLAATATMQLIQLVYTSKVVSVPFSKIFPWKNCGAYLIVNAFSALLIYVIKLVVLNHVQINNVVLAIALGILWAAAYASIIIRKIKKQWLVLNAER